MSQPGASFGQVLQKPSYYRGERVSLRNLGFDEKWLQDRIDEDPSILGLGDLSVLFKEKSQRPGGRLDFLLEDPETLIMYELEVMLGRLNESHIIRTIEYWDIERRRYPSRDHRAVIAAEEITQRFFNVIALFNQSIPIIALQLDAITVEDKVVLNFAKVLDIYELSEEDEPAGEVVDRSYWAKKSAPSIISIVDKCAAGLRDAGCQLDLAFNKSRITFSGPDRQFAWFRPRKNHCHMITLPLQENPLEDSRVQALEAAGMSVGERKRGRLGIQINPEQMEDNGSLVVDLLRATYASTVST